MIIFAEKLAPSKKIVSKNFIKLMTLLSTESETLLQLTICSEQAFSFREKLFLCELSRNNLDEAQIFKFFNLFFSKFYELKYSFFFCFHFIRAENHQKVIFLCHLFDEASNLIIKNISTDY